MRTCLLCVRAQGRYEACQTKDTRQIKATAGGNAVDRPAITPGLCYAPNLSSPRKKSLSLESLVAARMYLNAMSLQNVDA